jgi:hypothetical protein
MKTKLKPQRKLDKIELTEAWEMFLATHPSRADCYEHLEQKARTDKSWQCPKCKGQRYRMTSNRRKVCCLNCKSKSSLIWNTIFAHSKKIEVLYGALWLIGQGYIFSSKSFSEVAGVAQSTAWNDLHKVRYLMHAGWQDSDSVQSAEIPAEILSDAFNKRTRLTSAGAHPRTEQHPSVEHESKDNQSPKDFSDLSSSDRFGQTQELFDFCTNEPLVASLSDYGLDCQDETQRQILTLLSSGAKTGDEIIQSLGLPVPKVSVALIMLQLNEIVGQQPGDWWHIRLHHVKRSNGSPVGVSISPELEAKASELIKLLKHVHHGVSRKTIQLYVDDYSRVTNPGYWNEDKLISQGLRTKPITDDDISAYVSPLQVKLAA